MGVLALVKLPVSMAAGRLRGHADANLPLARLGGFRAELRACFTRRADALFELATRCCAPRWSRHCRI